MPRKRDHYHYELRHRRKIVYVGITDDPERREGEHECEGKRFTSMNIVRFAATKDTAQQ